LFLLGLDVGTSGCRSALYAPDGNMVAFGYREYSEYSPKPSWVELDPGEVWTKVRGCIGESIADIDPGEVAGLSLSALGEAVMPIDSEGNHLYPAITAYDARSSGYGDILKWWKGEIDPLDLFAITGTPLNSMPSVNKVLWIKENMPEVFEKANKFVCFEDFIIHKLTGRPAISHSMASRTMMLDISRRDWSEELLDLTDLDGELLSRALPSGCVAGEVTGESSGETGLPRGMPVVTGGHDQACGSLGVGVIGEGPVMDASGSVECIAAAMGKPVVTEQMMGFGQCCNCHTVEGLYLTLGFFPSSGIVLRWYRDTFAEREKEEAERRGVDVYDALTAEASKAQPGASGLMLLPHLFGSGTGQPPTLNRNSRGAIIGLSMFHNRASIIRAILEGVALELRRLLEFIEVCGIQATELRAVGGGARSPVWLQVKSNVTNRTFIRPDVTEAPSLGAAILAGVGTGIYRDFDNAIQTVYREISRFEPDPSLVPLYDRQYEVYKEIYPALVGIYDDLAELGSCDN